MITNELLPGQLLQKGVEVFKLGVLDNHFAAPVVIFDADLEAQCALQPVLDFANVGIDYRLRLGVLFQAFRMQETLDVGLRLANRKRKCGDPLRSLLDLLSVFESEERSSVPEAQFTGLNPGLNAGG